MEEKSWRKRKKAKKVPCAREPTITKIILPSRSDSLPTTNEATAPTPPKAQSTMPMYSMPIVFLITSDVKSAAVNACSSPT